MPLSGAERVLRARVAAYSKWARTPNRTEATAALRAGFDRRFELKVDPESRLDPAVRAVLVESARKAYFLRLVLLRVKAQSKKKKAREADLPRAQGGGADAAVPRPPT